MMNNILGETIWTEKFKGKTYGCYAYVTQIKMFVFGANRFGMTFNEKGVGQVIFVLHDQLQLR